MTFKKQNKKGRKMNINPISFGNTYQITKKAEIKATPKQTPVPESQKDVRVIGFADGPYYCGPIYSDGRQNKYIKAAMEKAKQEEKQLPKIDESTPTPCPEKV